MVIGRWWLVIGGRLRAAAGILILSIAMPAAAQTRALPTALSDSAFWKLVTDISEPGGYFRITDNFTSNEMEVGELFTMLRTTAVTGGVYIGVGPEQNLSYIAAIHPKMAFVVDIRRQAVMQHLMFKAMFELAKDRADFLTLLFAKPRPAGVDSTTGIQKMWEAYWPVPMDTALARKTMERVESDLTKTHHFVFTADEAGQLRSVLEAYQTLGPAISTRGGGRGAGPAGNRLFEDMTGYSVRRVGPAAEFSLERRELSLCEIARRSQPRRARVSGDFGGPKAKFCAIGSWLTCSRAAW